MKAPSIIYAIVLGLAASVQAQDKSVVPTDPSPLAPSRPLDTGKIRSVPDPAVTIGTGGAGAQTTSSIVSINMKLSGGRLVDAIAEIESHVSGGGSPQPMPNLIYGAADIPDLVVPGDLRLREVTTIQAVTLACAAAGCTLEPIYDPAEGTSSSEAVRNVIGYRIVRDSAPYFILSASKPMTFTGTGSVERIKSDIAAATAKLIELRARCTADHPSVIAGEKELVKLHRVLEQNTVESTRRGGFTSATQGGGVGSKGGGVGTFASVSQSSFGGRSESLMSSPQAATSADGAERVVRVYAIGSLLGKIDENSSAETLKRRSELILATQDLIGQTLDQAELNAAKSPDLAFNDSLRVLVAKATEAQHEIISQVIQALKENETVPAQANTVVPTAETPIPTPAPSTEKPKPNP
jgi:hypothetical protein